MSHSDIQDQFEERGRNISAEKEANLMADIIIKLSQTLLPRPYSFKTEDEQHVWETSVKNLKNQLCDFAFEIIRLTRK